MRDVFKASVANLLKERDELANEFLVNFSNYFVSNSGGGNPTAGKLLDKIINEQS